MIKLHTLKLSEVQLKENIFWLDSQTVKFLKYLLTTVSQFYFTELHQLSLNAISTSQRKNWLFWIFIKILSVMI